MSRRVAWLAFAVLSVGSLGASCTGSDGTASFDSAGGESNGAGGDEPSGGGKSSTSGTANTGATSSEGGGMQTEGGSGSPVAGQANAPGGSGTEPGEGGASSSGGAPGGGGDATFGGMPGSEGGAPGGDAGAGGEGPLRKPCESIKNCDEGELCVKAACDKQAEGSCQRAPAAPVCGCDGLTYFDGPLAIGAGVDVRNQGLCQGDAATTCEGECKGDNVSCGLVELRAGNCESKVGGICWQLPAECPAIAISMYNLCDSEKCLPLCEAVKEGVHAVPAGAACAVND